MEKMLICFVEDNPQATVDVTRILDLTQYIQTETCTSYENIPEDVIRRAQLFVLDVDIQKDDEDFCRFIVVLRNLHKPFIVFTVTSKRGTVRYPHGNPQLRELVFKHGGLGVISKNPDTEDKGVSHEDLRFALLERIMAFYWSRRGD